MNKYLRNKFLIATAVILSVVFGNMLWASSATFSSALSDPAEAHATVDVHHHQSNAHDDSHSCHLSSHLLAIDVNIIPPFDATRASTPLCAYRQSFVSRTSLPPYRPPQTLS